MYIIQILFFLRCYLLFFYELCHIFVYVKKFAAIWFSLLYVTFTVTAAGAISSPEFAGCDLHYTPVSKNNSSENSLAGSPCGDETHSIPVLVSKQFKHHLSPGKIKVPRLVSNTTSRNFVEQEISKHQYIGVNSANPCLHSTPVFLRCRVLRI